MGLVAVGLPWFANYFEADETRHAIADFRSNRLAPYEVVEDMQGYYESLNTASVQAGPLLRSLSRYEQQKARGGETYSEITRPADPLMKTELIPGWHGELAGATHNTEL